MPKDRRSRPLISDTLQKLIVRLFKQGKYINEIARELSLNRTTVHRHLVSEGLVEEDRNTQYYGAKRFTVEEVRGMLMDYQRGKTVNEILEHYNISRPAFYQHLRQSGLPKRNETDYNMDRAIKLYHEDRHSVKEILKRTRVPRTSFYRELNRRKEEE